MQVRVLFFGMLKDFAGHASEMVTLSEPARLSDVLRYCEERMPRLKAMSGSIAMSINQEYARPESELKAGDEVALLPPVSGGSQSTVDAPPRRGRYSEIVRERIDTASLLEGIKQPEDGAAVVFEGIVRNNTRGRRTLFLDYEAYEEMALKQMDGLAEQALSQFKVRDVRLVHRLGRLQIGETSVAVIVASAHRGPAFEACRWLIDTLKRSIPIWKKEHFEDGAVWADGEPFPDTIAPGGSSHTARSASK